MYVACALSLAWSTALATRRLPVTAPPLTPERFRPADLERQALAYLVLHSLPGQPYLYGDGYRTAITADQIRAARLDGQIVYLAACYGLGPVAAAFLDAGAAAVIADRDSNYAGLLWPVGANRMGRLLVRYLRQRLPAEDALYHAKRDFASGTDERGRSLIASLALVGDGTARLRA